MKFSKSGRSGAKRSSTNLQTKDKLREREKCKIGTLIVNHTYEIAEKSPQQQFEDNTKTSAVRTL
jgi:hypothetical protein